jgi:uncharacterized phosphosugar-binding protein
MLGHLYADAARKLIDRLEASQADNISRAAQAIAQALTHGGAFWLYGIGHGGELELSNRAGGLMAARVFSFSCHVSSPVADCLRGRPRPEPVEADLEQVRLAVRTSEMRAGDVLMTASVSGRNRVPIELALACRDLGITVIALTSLEYTAAVESLHPSGQKLCEVADLVVDSCVPLGDAGVEVDYYPHQVLPLSGLAHTVLGWMICGEAMERMQAAGTLAHVYMSHNRPGGPEYNEAALKEYNRTGW